MKKGTIYNRTYPRFPCFLLHWVVIARRNYLTPAYKLPMCRLYEPAAITCIMIIVQGMKWPHTGHRLTNAGRLRPLTTSTLTQRSGRHRMQVSPSTLHLLWDVYNLFFFVDFEVLQIPMGLLEPSHSPPFYTVLDVKIRIRIFYHFATKMFDWVNLLRWSIHAGVICLHHKGWE